LLLLMVACVTALVLLFDVNLKFTFLLWPDKVSAQKFFALFGTQLPATNWAKNKDKDEREKNKWRIRLRLGGIIDLVLAFFILLPFPYFLFPLYCLCRFILISFFCGKGNCNKVWQQLRAANKPTANWKLQSTMATMVWQLPQKKSK